jgi:predicted SAM-dependent methyltransferase
MPKTVLNLGCGNKRLPDAVNVDCNARVHPDVVHDLNCRPWPFADDSFADVVAYDVIEHCNDVIATMEEIHRVSRKGAIVKITVPHFSCANAYIDPTHKHQFGHSSFNYFTGEHEFSFYTDKLYRRRTGRIVFAHSLINRVVSRLANRFPEGYEQRWAWMFPAWFLYFELAIVK